MSTIVELEKRLVDSIVRDEMSFPEAVDSLLSFLLTGGKGRPTDGVILELQEVSKCQASGRGIVILVEGQLVDRIQVEVLVDQQQAGLASATILVGTNDRAPAKYGSSGHQDMVKSIFADSSNEIPWRRRFYRDETGWSSFDVNGQRSEGE